MWNQRRPFIGDIAGMCRASCRWQEAERLAPAAGKISGRLLRDEIVAAVTVVAFAAARCSPVGQRYVRWWLISIWLSVAVCPVSADRRYLEVTVTVGTWR